MMSLDVSVHDPHVTFAIFALSAVCMLTLMCAVFTFIFTVLLHSVLLLPFIGLMYNFQCWLQKSINFAVANGSP